MESPIQQLQALLNPYPFVSHNKTYGITLTFSAPTVYVAGVTQGYRLFCRASEACNMPEEIFVYQRKPQVYENQSYKDDFCNIASLPDIQEWAVGAPTDSTKPFFRLNFVDLVFRNFGLLEAAFLGINQQVTELVNSLESNDLLAAGPAIRIGVSEPCGSSSSSHG